MLEITDLTVGQVIEANVTARDILLGQPMQALACPLARALGRLIGGASVSVYEAHVSQDSGYAVLHMAEATENFRDSFDNGREVRPGRYAYTVTKVVPYE
jgi:hypothetical protein